MHQFCLLQEGREALGNALSLLPHLHTGTRSRYESLVRSISLPGLMYGSTQVGEHMGLAADEQLIRPDHSFAV